MNTLDHKKLGTRLEEILPEKVTAFQRKMFNVGCVQPDWNPFTYLKGSTKYQKFYGHNYNNAKKSVKKYMKRLSKKSNWTLVDYYKAGKLMHYVADAFTFPHNEEFGGTIKDHVKYELKFHRQMDKYLSSEEHMKIVYLYINNKNKNLFWEFTEEHRRFIDTRRSMEDDIEYICRISVYVLLGMLEMVRDNGYGDEKEWIGAYL